MHCKTPSSASKMTAAFYLHACHKACAHANLQRSVLLIFFRPLLSGMYPVAAMIMQKEAVCLPHAADLAPMEEEAAPRLTEKFYTEGPPQLKAARLAVRILAGTWGCLEGREHLHGTLLLKGHSVLSCACCDGGVCC